MCAAIIICVVCIGKTYSRSDGLEHFSGSKAKRRKNNNNNNKQTSTTKRDKIDKQNERMYIYTHRYNVYTSDRTHSKTC